LGFVRLLDCVWLLDCMGDTMRVRRHHAIEVARYYQRLENIERRRKEAEEAKKNKKGFFRRLLSVK